MEPTQSLSNGELLLICLAVFAAVLIFPRLLRRRRIQKQVWEKRQKGEAIRPEDFTGKQKLFHTHNGKASEIEQFLATLKSHASRHGMKIVFPGNFLCNNTVSPSSMILVGRFGLRVIRCYGFGGHIYTEQNGKRFMQNMNETIKEITNPIRSMEQEEDLARLLLCQTPWKQLPIFSASVFTRPNVILDAPENSRVFDRSHFMYWLTSDPRFQSDAGTPIEEVSAFLVEAVRKGRETSA